MKQNEEQKKETVQRLHLKALTRYCYDAPVIVSGDFDDEALNDLLEDLHEIVEGELNQECSPWENENCCIDDCVPQRDPEYEVCWDGTEED